MTIVVLSKDSATKFSIFMEKVWRLNWELFEAQALVDFEMLDGECVGVVRRVLVNGAPQSIKEPASFVVGGRVLPEEVVGKSYRIVEAAERGMMAPGQTGYVIERYMQ